MIAPRKLAPLLVLLAVPLSSASGTLEAGPVWVEVRNGVSGACVLPGDPFCVAAAEGDSVGALEISAEQEIQYAGVGIETDAMESAVGVPLLPDQSVSIRGSDILIGQPLFPLIVDKTGGRIAPPVIGDSYYLTIKPEGVFLNYYGLEARNESEPLGHREYGIAFEDRFIGYEQIGPADMVDWDDTDYRAYNAAVGVCSLDASGACEAEVVPRVNASQRATPNVALGIAVGELEVASDADLLGPSFSDYVRAPSSVTPLRMMPAATAATLEPPTSKGKLILDDLSLAVDRPTPTHADGTAAAEGASGVQSSTSVPPPATAKILLLTAGGLTAVLLLAAFILYSRLRGKDLLSHPHRAAIAQKVQASPGITIAQLVKELKLSRTAAAHHVRTLEKSGLIRIEHQNRRVFVFPAGFRADTPPVVAVDRTKAAIFDIIRAHPDGLSRAAIAALTPHIPKRTRNHALRKLQELRLIETAKSAPEGLVTAAS